VQSVHVPDVVTTNDIDETIERFVHSHRYISMWNSRLVIPYRGALSRDAQRFTRGVRLNEHLKLISIGMLINCTVNVVVAGSLAGATETCRHPVYRA